jgi:hypothetical protein
MRISILAVFLPLMLVVPALAEDKPTREDISTSMYTVGEVLIPVAASSKSGKGYVYRMDKEAFGGKLPEVPAEIRPADVTTWLVEKMRHDKLGDLYFNVSPNGRAPVLLVISGKARDLGKKYLRDFNDKTIDPPTEWPPADPKRGVPVSGWVADPQVGHVYVIETVDGTHAIFRVVARGDGGIDIQYALPHQKITVRWDLPGSMTLDASDVNVELPRNVPPALNPPVAATREMVTMTSVTLNPPPMTVGPVNPPTVSPIRPPIPAGAASVKVAALLRDREALLHTLVPLATSEPTSAGDRTIKAAAITQLGQIGAVEAVASLVGQISFMDPSDQALTGDTLKLHPAVGALISLGKPASNAALHAMHETRKNNSPMLTPMYKTMLLTTVVRRIEGDEVAEFLFKRELEKADAEHKANFEQALRELKTNAGGN